MTICNSVEKTIDFIFFLVTLLNIVLLVLLFLISNFKTINAPRLYSSLKPFLKRDNQKIYLDLNNKQSPIPFKVISLLVSVHKLQYEEFWINICFVISLDPVLYSVHVKLTCTVFYSMYICINRYVPVYNNTGVHCTVHETI